MPNLRCNLEEEIEKYFKDKDEVIAVYLFGSYAKGKERRMSDIDIGIFINKTNHAFARAKRDMYMVELSRIFRKDIHPVILNLASEELLRQIFTDGRCVLVNDQEELSRKKMISFAKIADFGYYRDRMQAGLINSLI